MAASLRGAYVTANSKVQTGVVCQVGDVVVVLYNSSYTGANTPTCADSAGNTYARQGAYTYNSNPGCGVAVMLGIVTTGGTVTVTVTDANSSYPGIMVLVYSGLVTSSMANLVHAAPVFKAETTAATSHTGPSITTKGAALLINFEATQYNGVTRAVTGGSFTEQKEQAATNYMTACDRSVTGSGTYNLSYSTSDSNKDEGLIIALNIATTSTYDPTKMLACF